MTLGGPSVALTSDPPDDRGKLIATMFFALTWIGNPPLGHASAGTFHLRSGAFGIGRRLVGLR